MLGGDDLDEVAFVAEEIAEEFVLALAGGVGRPELDDGNVGLLGAAELFIRLQQGLQKVLAATDARQGILLADFLDRRNIPEQFRQRVGVTGAGGGIGIVLHKVQVPVDQVRIQARRHFQSLIAGVDRGQHFFGRQQFQARQQGWTGEHHLLHTVDCRDQGLAGLYQRIILPP